MQCTFFSSLSNLVRFNLDHGVSAILFVCSVQEHVLDTVGPKRLWLVVSSTVTCTCQSGKSGTIRESNQASGARKAHARSTVY